MLNRQAIGLWFPCTYKFPPHLWKICPPCHLPHGWEQGFRLWHSCRDSLHLCFPLAECTVLFTMQDKASPRQKLLLVWAGLVQDVMGYFMLIWQSTMIMIGRSVWHFVHQLTGFLVRLCAPNFPFSSLYTSASSLILIQWTTALSVIKTLKSCENAGHKAPTAPLGHPDRRRMWYWEPVPPQPQKGVFVEICYSLMEALMWQSQPQTCQYFESSITQFM